ncbi:MAG: YraN family protein [Defluviitaleaceae bacterium]|nr:YraN family protein [Defluviitaleaceae bacterium]MCL2239397.1 YraN family protein [Defluviitaleaceae bacterium]
MPPNKHAAGMEGQQQAEDFLCKKGLRIRARNYRAKTGEIDLIANDGETIIFIEVKARTSLKYGHPREAVTPAKQQRIMRTAQHYIALHRLHNNALRFDVVEIIVAQGEIHIEHIENAFWG